MKSAGPRILITGASHEQHGGSFINARNIVLCPPDSIAAASHALGGGGEVVGIGTGIRFGNRKGHLYLARGHGGQPFSFLRLASVLGDNGSTDGRRDNQEEMRATLSGKFLAHNGQFRNTSSFASVLRRSINTQETVPGQILPQLVHLATILGLLVVIVVAKA